MKKKNTKIVATISDKRCDVEFLQELYNKGMNVVRLNTAHQTLEDALKVITNVRKVSDQLAIIVDTKGAEIRTTEVYSPIKVKAGETIFVAGAPKQKTTRECLCVSYPDFTNELEVGNSILIDDGEIKLVVKKIVDDKLLCVITNDGIIKSRKSINVPGVRIKLPSLSDKDLVFIDFAIKNNVDFIAHSFVRSKEDVLVIQRILDKENSGIKVIAKIENQVGVDNIDEILEAAYGVMVARGDLGIEIPYEYIPGVQKHLIHKCNERKKPVIIATQMLHTMIENPRPTRAEVSDVANAIYHEVDAVMLSGETAYGDYPIETVETMARIADRVEASREVRENINTGVPVKNEIAVFLADSAVRAAHSLPVKAIVLDTLTGRTARYLAAFRGKNNVFAICYSQAVMRELALSYGIYAEYLPIRNSTEQFKKDALNMLLKKQVLQTEDLVLMIGGSFGPRNGATFLDISTVDNLRQVEIDEKLFPKT